MREFRTSGSEGGWASNGPVYPTSFDHLKKFQAGLCAVITGPRRVPKRTQARDIRLSWCTGWAGGFGVGCMVISAFDRYFLLGGRRGY